MIWYNFYTLCSTMIPLYRMNECNNMQQQRAELLLMQKYIDLYTVGFGIEDLPEQTMEISGKNNNMLVKMFFAPAICAFEDPVNGLQLLPVTGEWKFDIAGNPTEWEVFGCNGYRKRLNKSNSVLIFNDDAYSIPFMQMLYNIRFMLECDNTHRQNLKAQRQPMIAEIEEDEKKSASTFIEKLNGFADTILFRKRPKKEKSKVGENPYELKTFESGRQFQGDLLASDYRYFDNRNLTLLGFDNENMEKKERLLVDEVNSNNAVVSAFYTIRYEHLKDGFDKVNKMFGTNIKVVPKLLKSIKTEADNDKTLQQGNATQRPDSTLEKTNG